MRKDRRTKEAGNPRESGRLHRSRERPGTRRESECALIHRRNDRLQGSLERAPRHGRRPPATKFGEDSSRSLLRATRRRLVDDPPEDAKFLDRIDELVKIDRLYDI